MQGEVKVISIDLNDCIIVLSVSSRKGKRFYYIKVSGIPSGNKLIKTIRYFHSLSLKLYLNSLVYHRNIFGSSSKVFGSLQKFSENVRVHSSGLRNNFRKSSEIFRK